MKTPAHTRGAYIGLTAVAAVFAAYGTCRGFGGVSVGGLSVGGLSVGGLSLAGTAAVSGGGVSAGTGASGYVSPGVGGGAALGSGNAAGGATAGSGVSVSSSAVAAVVGSAPVDTAQAGGAATAGPHNGSPSVKSALRAQQLLAKERAALQMGMGPVQPDRGMAQALHYYAHACVTPLTSAADRALENAVAAVPQLPGAAAVADPSGQAAAAPTASAAADADSPAQHPADPTGMDKAPSRQPPPRMHTVPNPKAGMFAHRPVSMADKAPPQPKHAAAAAPSAPLRHESDALRVVEIPPAQPIATSIVSDPAAAPADSAAQFRQAWQINGTFSDVKATLLPTGVPILVVMLLSAASAYGFVRLMSEKCPRCALLLQRHSVACRNCGTRLTPSNREPEDLRPAASSAGARQA